MIKNTRLLVFLSVFTLIALTGIQSYLIFNTYKLKKKDAINNARISLAKVYTTKKIDSLMWIYRNDFLVQLEQFEQGKISKDQVLKNLEIKTEEVNPVFREAYQNGLKDQNLPFTVKFNKSAISIFVKDSLDQTTSFLSQSDAPIFLLGDKLGPDEESILVNNSSWNKDHEIIIDGQSQTFLLDFKTQIYMSVENWRMFVAKQMTILLLLSCLLFLFMTGLFYYSIKSLMKQKKLSEIKTDFINNMTHELKTPLSTLSIATQNLTDNFDHDDKSMSAEIINVINRQNIRLQKLIDQVLNSSLGYQEIELEKEEIEFVAFMEELIDDFKIPLPDNIEIRFLSDLKSATMVLDRFYISTAILNILNNAVKYGGTVVDIHFSKDTSTNSYLLNIHDNGIGIDKKHLPNLFQKFYRVSEKDQHNYKGLGLGLYYAKQIITAHKGTISVKSSRSTGTTFTIKLHHP
ncbi:sensor histidine kinase KdpD [Mangrovimonas sp. ST2L15]|uniref:sensor histidine kinase n=1 Tax=Mangrovimonas sp. ST2L15 TaxID=1645916 RepID=UPI0006B5A0DC|nr:HAMP domain-containing sensor histidine kinase [Mangrovimonas sp. ST2L15]